MNVDQFLYCETPDEWIQQANDHIDILLVDHANCEKKAASTALNLMYRYDSKHEMVLKLSKLAREELRHFEQVVGIMKKRNINYQHISSARYAGELRKGVRTFEPARLVDILIVCAIVEARSCERFSRLIEVLDQELADFYSSLLKSEDRHYRLYLGFAEQYSDSPIDERVAYFLSQDQKLIQTTDEQYRFHSGPTVNHRSQRH